MVYETPVLWYHHHRKGMSWMSEELIITLDTGMQDFPNVGESRAKKLEKLGILKAEHLLNAYPRGYEDRRQIYTIGEAPLGVRVCISALASEHPRLSHIRKGMELVQLKIVDGGGAIHVTFFNQSYVQRALRAGEEYIFYGIVEEQGRRRTMTNPIFERMGERTVTGCIVPIYHLTAGISNHMMSLLTRRAVADCANLLEESLPARIVKKHRLMGLVDAVSAVHFPDSMEAVEEARRRLSFEELFYLSIGLDLLKARRVQGQGIALSPRNQSDFDALLSFSPTNAQSRVMGEIVRDLVSGQPMNRLLQGDVGSGKTVVAAFAGWLTAKSGGQTAMMAPTEVLAEQHYKSLSALLGKDGLRVGLLTGGQTAGEKRRVKAALAKGEIDFVVGTHALISKDVTFLNLALVVADEQHRFGVHQRAALTAKTDGDGEISPHVLVMSATPIPRTLALIVYGDLEVSVLDELPAGRTPIESFVVGESKRERMYNFVRTLVSEGRQVYIVCPAIEEQDLGDDAPPLNLKAVKDYAVQLQQEIFPDLTVDLLHGKMKPREKERVMSQFFSGETQILVATTVIEVGLDVPNAALMVIENADRFGLSQLHQLRGRVGRGSYKSFCVLVTATRNPDTMLRLKTLVSTTDGFKISEEDLKLRGPGDFFGSRQHGLPQLRVADLMGDMRTLSEAQEAARTLIERDPQLKKKEHIMVYHRVKNLFSETPDIFN